jgi:epoxyqueuosine reductase
MHFDQEELKTILAENGADLVGFADLSEMLGPEEKYGISVAVKLPREIVLSIMEGPTRAYFDQYHELNGVLDRLVTEGAEYLQSCGYHATAQTTDSIVEYGTYMTRMPHKTVAVRAGLGWIGKSALFVTEDFGSAVRLSSILTDAPVIPGEPVTASKCGDCMICSNSCPGKAISGKRWQIDLDRDSFFDPLACRKKAREIAAEAIQEEITLCGKCIAVCPYTRKYAMA